MGGAIAPCCPLKVQVSYIRVDVQYGGFGNGLWEIKIEEVQLT